MTELMERSWTTGAYWYHAAVHSNGILSPFFQHIRPTYGASKEKWRYWRKDAHQVMEQKLDDKKAYLQRLGEVTIALSRGGQLQT